MRTVKALMVRKPINFEEVLKITKKYIEEAESVIVEKTVELTEATYQKLIDNPLTETFDFLKNQGGMKDGKMLTIGIKCKDRPTLLINAEGYGYARYMGIALNELTSVLHNI